MRISDVFISSDEPLRVQGKSYIDEVSIMHCMGHYERQMLVRRTYHKIADRIDASRTLPAWQRFAKARQGRE